jgi:hypothetical protein
MNKLTLTKCKICGEEKTSRGFSFHISQTHGLKIEDYIIKYEFNNIHPLCKCGCGEKVTIRGYAVMDYKNSHAPASKFNKEKCSKRGDQWKINLRNGIRKWNKEQKEKNPNYRSGKNNNFYGKNQSYETRQKLSKLTEKQIKDGKHPFIGNDNGRIKKSSLEVKFEEYLIKNNINYIQSYKISYINDKNYDKYKYYDFYLPEIKCLIEIHGLYWHPKNLNSPVNEIQVKNYHNDIFKKNLAKQKGYNLVSIYDYELDDFLQENKIINLFAERKDVEKLVVEIEEN